MNINIYMYIYFRVRGLTRIPESYAIFSIIHDMSQFVCLAWMLWILRVSSFGRTFIFIDEITR